MNWVPYAYYGYKNYTDSLIFSFRDTCILLKNCMTQSKDVK